MTEGERWTRELLLELRAARYTHHGRRSFLARALERAGDERRRNRRAHGQVLVLLGAGLASWAAVGLAGHPVLAVVGGFWWLHVALMLDWHLGMLERADGRRLQGLGVANVVTLTRAGLVPALPALSPPALAVALLVAGVTDVLDGWWARRRDEVTRLGFWLDGTIDTLVLGVGIVAAARVGLVPNWIAGLVVVRYAFPWLAVAGLYFVHAQAPPRDGHVSGRIPGAALVVGVALAAVHPPAGVGLAAAGAIGGLIVVCLTLVRSTQLRDSSVAAGVRDPGFMPDS